MTELSPGNPALGPSKDRESFLFVTCFVALVATSFAFIIRVILMDQWQIAFDLSETQKGEIYGAGMWPFGVSIVLFSLVIDRIGYGKSMIFAFACHVASAILLVMAQGYWALYVGSVLNGLAAGTVEAVINPAVASMYPRKKTTMLTILHAGWPGGMALGGIVMLLIGDVLAWQLKAGIILIPTCTYGVMLLKARFPVSERVVAGVPYRDMLKEAGALGCLFVLYLIGMEVNRVLGLGTLLDSAFFDLPSWQVTAVLAALVLAYLNYTRSAGRPMYIFLLVVMILLAITELGTDTWIKDLMKPAMSRVRLNAGWVLVYTSTIMMILRFCIAPIVRALKPLGVLLVSSLFAAAGLYLLSGAQGGWILIWATIYGVGQCFFWPVTLGLVSERFPRGGALTLNAISGVGMLGVGILGAQMLGFWQDTRIDEQLQPRPALYGQMMDPAEKASIFGSYRALNSAEVTRIEDIAILYAYRGTAEKPLADDPAYRTLIHRAMVHVKPVAPSVKGADPQSYDVERAAWEQASTYEARLAYLTDRGYFPTAKAWERIERTKTTLDIVRADAKRHAMATVAILPLIMAACYTGLILYFRTKGGYKAIDLTAAGEIAGEHLVTDEEAVADAEATPSQ